MEKCGKEKTPGRHVSSNLLYPPRDGKDFKGFLPQLDEIYFTTAKKKILENYRCIVPNFMND
jgi:hypothetical protein